MSVEKHTLNDIIRKFQDLENLIIESEGEITDDLENMIPWTFLGKVKLLINSLDLIALLTKVLFLTAISAFKVGAMPWLFIWSQREVLRLVKCDQLSYLLFIETRLD